MNGPSAPPLDLPPPQEVMRERWLLHAALFLTTFACVLGTQLLETGSLAQGLSFALALLAILLAHEMGHYVVGRLHRVSISPPYFIPFPLGIGTLGAVIRIRSPFPTKDALVDIGAAGPIAGMLVAIPVLLWGMAHSRFMPASYEVGQHYPGQLSLIHLVQWLVRHAQRGDVKAALGASSQHAVQYFGDSLLTLAAQRLTLGPTPPGMDVNIHPVALAGWFGLLVTWLNLLPIGQLDGGHVMYALFGRHARWVGHAMHLLMLGLVVFASVMVLPWLLLTRYLVGTGHPPLTRPEVPMSRARYIVSAISILLLVLTFIPVPIELRFAP